MHRTAVTALAALLLLASTAAAAKRSPCQRLEGVDLAPAAKVVLVERPNDDDGTDLLGCVLPRGKVRTLASGFDSSTSGATWRLVQVAGRFALVTSSSDSQYGNASATTVVDVRTGAAYSIASVSSDVGELASAVIDDRGRAAAYLTTPWPDRRATIAAYAGDGARLDLDTGTPFELTDFSFADGTISWKHDGVLRSAHWAH